MLSLPLSPAERSQLSSILSAFGPNIRQVSWSEVIAPAVVEELNKRGYSLILNGIGCVISSPLR